MMCPMERNKRVGCFNHECHKTGMCMDSAEMPTREERKEPMEQETAMHPLAADAIKRWYSAPADALERDLLTLSLFEPLTTEQRRLLIDTGKAILAAKLTIEPPKLKRGRPAGSRTKKEGGNGE